MNRAGVRWEHGVIVVKMPIAALKPSCWVTVIKLMNGTKEQVVDMAINGGGVSVIRPGFLR
jgi:hypothetical protein